MGPFRAVQVHFPPKTGPRTGPDWRSEATGPRGCRPATPAFLCGGRAGRKTSAIILSDRLLMTSLPSQTILVTGAAGFIGFHMARRLLTQLIGPMPRTDLQDGVGEFVDWYRDYMRLNSA